MSQSSGQAKSSGSGESSESQTKTIQSVQKAEIEKGFRDFKSVLDMSSIEPLSIFSCETDQQINQKSVIFEKDEDFEDLAMLLSKHGEPFAKVEIECLKELQVVNLYEVEQLINQRKSLMVQVNNICQFFTAQGVGESKIDLMMSHSNHEDSSVQVINRKMMQCVNKEEEFIQAVEGQIRKTLEQLKGKDHLAIEFNFVIQQTLFRFHSYMKELHEFCKSDSVFQCHIKRMKAEAKKNITNAKLVQMIKENLALSPKKENDDDPHLVMKQELNSPSNGSSGKSVKDEEQTQKSNKKGAKNRSKTPRQADRQPPDSQATTPRRGRKPNEAAKTRGTPSRQRGRPKQNVTPQNTREALLKKADKVLERKRLEKQKGQGSSDDQNDDSSSEKEQVENEQNNKSNTSGSKSANGGSSSSQKSKPQKSDSSESSGQKKQGSDEESSEPKSNKS